MDDDARPYPAAAQEASPRLRPPRWQRAAKETPGTGAPFPNQSQVQTVSDDECRFDGVELASGQYGYQRGSAVESRGARAAHRSRSPYGTDAQRPGLHAR